MKLPKPNMTFSQIINMNVGFLGIQYSFGLQQTAINPIYSFLGADPSQLPYLNLAGPITGLLIQPIIGALSDKTYSAKWGRRKPYFLIGAIFCSLSLFLFPFSSSLWMAAGLLWILDAANNTAMEPYRTFIADKLNEQQQPTGFLAQSFFTGLGITLANFSLYFFQKFFSHSEAKVANSIPQWVYYSFFIGAVISISTVLYSMKKTPEIPPTDEELIKIRERHGGFFFPLVEIVKAIKEMPKVMWQMAAVYLFQWYALFCYWQYASLSIAKSIWNTTDTSSVAYEEAVAWTGINNGFYNIVTFLCAFYLANLASKYSPKMVHGVSLLLASVGLFAFPFITNQYLSLLPMIGLGIAWASIMGVPYLIIVPAIPKEKYGVYMGIINMLIVIPMLIQTISFKFVFKFILQDNVSNVMLLASVFLLIAALLTFAIKKSLPSFEKKFD